MTGAADEVPPAAAAPRDERFTDGTTWGLNRALHFVLEVTVWVALAAWGWHNSSGLAQGFLTAGPPLAVILTWTWFGVPRDPWLAGGKLGAQPWVAIPGWVRLLYEALVHGLAAAALLDLGWTDVAWGFLAGTALHYLVSWQRVRWLLRPRDAGA